MEVGDTDDTVAGTKQVDCLGFKRMEDLRETYEVLVELGRVKTGVVKEEMTIGVGNYGLIEMDFDKIRGFNQEIPRFADASKAKK